MRVKSFLAAAGITAVAAVLAVPGMSNASRLPNPSPAASTDAPAPTVADTPTTQPVVTPTTTTVTSPPAAEPTTQPQPVVETHTAPLLARTPKPTVPTTAPAVHPPANVEDTPVTVDTKPVAPPAPAGAAQNGSTDEAGNPADPCHMDSYQRKDVGSFPAGSGEALRAEKVDRNHDGVVCQKIIPGHGRGNTGNGSNIKDDQIPQRPE
jgi:hypothetical protein